MPSIHKAVLLNEIVTLVVGDWLTAICRDQQPIWYFDGTLGGAGHALAIAEALEGRVNVIGLDRDPQAIERAKAIFKERLEGKMVILECENFRNLDLVLDKHGIRAVDFILLDLGISSDELENSGKGFSFLKDEPLLMTMGNPDNYPFTAGDIVNTWRKEDVANVIFAYGEERFARRITKAIVASREKKVIETSLELARIIESAMPRLFNRRKIHPATKTFQALRIAVNDELEALKSALDKGYERLNAGGRMAVISFHSLEDRIVKNFFKDKTKIGANIVTKKPIRPKVEEIAENPRARSAKLRVIEKSK